MCFVRTKGLPLILFKSLNVSLRFVLTFSPAVTISTCLEHKAEQIHLGPSLRRREKLWTIPLDSEQQTSWEVQKLNFKLRAQLVGCCIPVLHELVWLMSNVELEDDQAQGWPRSIRRVGLGWAPPPQSGANNQIMNLQI